VAVAVAIVATIALSNKEEGIPRDSYTVAADRICVDAKKQIGRAGDRVARTGAGVGRYASQVVQLVGQWRVDFGNIERPGDRAEEAAALDAALRNVEVEAGALALATQRGAGDVPARARRLDRATEDVERAIRDLGLDQCARIVILPGARPQP
jgi:hypothetical protein